MNDEMEIRKKIRMLENTRRILVDKLDINNKLVNVMINKPKKLQPTFDFENDPEYLRIVKRKWLNDNELQNLQIRQQIQQVDSELDHYRGLLSKNKKKEESVVKTDVGDSNGKKEDVVLVKSKKKPKKAKKD